MLGLRLSVEVRSPDELERAFAAINGARAEALFPLPSPLLFAERRRIVELAARDKLPGMFNTREFVELGGLIAYGASIADLNSAARPTWTRFEGCQAGRPAGQQPTNFELLINLKAAKTLGIDIPLLLQQRADEVIE